MRRHRLVPAVAACAAVATALLAVPGAQADNKQAHSKNWHIKTLSDFALAPFNLAINHNKVYVADGFLNTVGVIGQAPLVTADSGDVAGIDLTPDGKTMAWTWSNDDHTDTRLTIRTRGKADVVAQIAAVEAAQNPDKVNTYGVLDYGAGATASKKACVNAVFEGMGGEEGQAPPVTYQGLVDSHPYSVVRADNRWIVADAGANNLWSITDKGVVSNLTVLPPQPLTFTAEMANALGDMFGAPPGATACLEGVTYAFEPVPTDVEVARDGSLWVSVLPGGVESPIFGANGAVYKVNAKTGKATLVTKGFLGATNLAVAPEGTVYVAELFGGKVSKIGRNGAISTVANLPGALSVEVHGGFLYVGTMADFDFETGTINAPGSIVKLKR